MQEIGGAERLGVLRRRASWVLGALVVILAVTGTYLWFRYQPSASQAWGQADRGREPWDVARAVHRWTAYATGLVAFATGALVVGEALEAGGSRRRQALGATAGAVLLTTVILAGVSGFLLPWDQLALKAVTVGTDYAGFGPLFGDEVRFVLIGGAEVATSTVRAVAVLHLALSVVLVAGIVRMMTLQPRTGRRTLEA